MINPKYDPNNYLKHLAVAVITDNQKINQLFGSYLLRVRWWHDNPKVSPQSDLIGTLRVHMDTPFGAIEPRDYQFKISSHKQIYVQFLTIPIPEFEYKIEVIHPVGLTRSKIEIWEYNKPINYSQIPSNMPPVFGQDDTAINALTAAMATNTAAVTSMAAANPSADAIADAIANNSMVTLPAAVFAVGTGLVNLLAKSLLTQKVTLKNLTANKIKIWIGDTAPVIPAGLPGAGGVIVFSTPGETVEIPANNGTYEVPDNLCKSGIYAICNNSGGSVSVTRTYTN